MVWSFEMPQLAKRNVTRGERGEVERPGGTHGQPSQPTVTYWILGGWTRKFDDSYI
jgi:hypothetical protein